MMARNQRSVDSRLDVDSVLIVASNRQSKGNHIWTVEAKKLDETGTKWEFRPFAPCIKGVPSTTAHIGAEWSWSPRIWSPQQTLVQSSATWSATGLPVWLSWNGSILSGSPPESAHAQCSEIVARASFSTREQTMELELSFTLKVLRYGEQGSSLVSAIWIVLTRSHARCASRTRKAVNRLRRFEFELDAVPFSANGGHCRLRKSPESFLQPPPVPPPRPRTPQLQLGRSLPSHAIDEFRYRLPSLTPANVGDEGRNANTRATGSERSGSDPSSQSSATSSIPPIPERESDGARSSRRNAIDSSIRSSARRTRRASFAASSFRTVENGVCADDDGSSANLERRTGLARSDDDHDGSATTLRFHSLDQTSSPSQCLRYPATTTIITPSDAIPITYPIDHSHHRFAP